MKSLNLVHAYTPPQPTQWDPASVPLPGQPRSWLCPWSVPLGTLYAQNITNPSVPSTRPQATQPASLSTSAAAVPLPGSLTWIDLSTFPGGASRLVGAASAACGFACLLGSRTDTPLICVGRNTRRHRRRRHRRQRRGGCCVCHAVCKRSVMYGVLTPASLGKCGEKRRISSGFYGMF